jgi:anti-sigma factor RsiW
MTDRESLLARLSPERAERIEQALQACRDTAERLQQLSEQRTRLFRELHAEGWKVKDLAEIAGVTPQRMSKVLNPIVTPRGRAVAPRASRLRVSPYDAWL